jgi:hypothetical protein
MFIISGIKSRWQKSRRRGKLIKQTELEVKQARTTWHQVHEFNMYAGRCYNEGTFDRETWKKIDRASDDAWDMLQLKEDKQKKLRNGLDWEYV